MSSGKQPSYAILFFLLSSSLTITPLLEALFLATLLLAPSALHPSLPHCSLLLFSPHIIVPLSLFPLIFSFLLSSSSLPLSSSSLPLSSSSPSTFLLSFFTSYSKRSNFISRLPPKQRTNLNSYLEYLGEVCTCACRYTCIANTCTSVQMDKVSQLTIVQYEMVVFCAALLDTCK